MASESKVNQTRVLLEGAISAHSAVTAHICGRKGALAGLQSQGCSLSC